jgi:very-short-patch-repair endonuclease
MGKKIWDHEKFNTCVQNAGDELITPNYLGYSKNHEIRCGKCSKIYQITIRNYMRGHRCKTCSMNGVWDSMRLDIDTVRKYCEKFGCELKSEFYVNSWKDLEIICACKNVFSTSFAEFSNKKSNHQCQNCSKKQSQLKQSISIGEIESFLKNYNYKLDDYEGFINGSTPINFSDDEGYKYRQSYNSFRATFLNNNRSKIFSKNNPFVYENIKLWLKNKLKPFSFIKGEFRNDSLKSLYFKCDKCDNEWDVSWNAVMSGGEGCPFCSGKRVYDGNCLYLNYPEVSLDWNYDENKKTPNDYTFGSHYVAKWCCHKCNYDWNAPIKRRTLEGRGCPNCAPISKGEDAIFENLLKNGFEESDILRWYRFIDCRRIKPLSFDFYIPNINVCIEFQGLQHIKPIDYFGGEKSFKEQKEKDKIKKEYCENRGIKLIEIFDLKEIEKNLERELLPFL